MSDVRAAVIAFAPRSGAGAQTVSGVSDADGDFSGKAFFWICPYVPALNTVTSGSAGTGAYQDQRGVDTGAIRSAASSESLYTPFSFKGVALGVSLGDDSILDVWTTNFGSYSFDRTAKITAIRDGEFDLTYTSNYAVGAGERILVVVLGGTDLDLTFTDVAPGTYTVPSTPQGLLAYPVPIPAASGLTGGAVGGIDFARGFATRDGAYGAASINVVAQGNNWTVQRSSAWNAAISDIGGLGNLTTVSAWGDTSLTYANGAAANTAPVVICGDLVRTAGGVFTQPTSTGSQVIDLGLTAKVVWMFSIGQESATTVFGSPGQYTEGWATATAQISYWGGDATNGNAGPQTGARILSTDTLLRFGTPAAGSTTFSAVATLTDLSGETATLEWTTVDSTPREILWFAIGEGTLPPPPPPTPVYRTREVVRRRLRRAPIVWNEKGGLQTRVRINLFAVDMQPGVGTSDTPDPLVMVRCSKDGGFTWGNERRVSAGRIGEYFDRINTWQWGQGREWVFEVSCTDPVTWNLVGAYLDAEGGEN